MVDKQVVCTGEQCVVFQKLICGNFPKQTALLFLGKQLSLVDMHNFYLSFICVILPKASQFSRKNVEGSRNVAGTKPAETPTFKSKI